MKRSADKVTSDTRLTVEALPKATGLTLGFEEGEQVAFAHGSLHVSDDRAVGVVKELDADLSDTTTGAGAPDDFRNFRQFERLVLLNQSQLGQYHFNSLVVMSFQVGAL